MNEVKMAKVIMELGEFGEFWEEYQRKVREAEYYQKGKYEAEDKYDKLASAVGEWMVLMPSGDRKTFQSYWEAKKYAVETAERTKLTVKIAEIKETVTKGEEF